MQILVAWKPVVLVWGLLSGMVFVGFVASSLLQGKDSFAPSITIAQPAGAEKSIAQASHRRQSQKSDQTPSQ
jgi:hypothetical protein